MSAPELDAKQANDSTTNDTYNYPPAILKRLQALRKLQLDMFDIESKFYEELHQLECKYSSLYNPLFEKREKIINGDYEPNDEESKVPSQHTDIINRKSESSNEQSESNKIDLNQHDLKGIPGFWLQAFSHTDLISDMIQEYDEPVLKHLRDIKIKMHHTKPLGYTIEFYFNENEFFTNKILTKTYELTCDNQEDDPFSYDGPVMYRSIGTKIEWQSGKDVTVKLVKKKQKHKASGTIRVINKEEKQDSFFNFFDPPTYDGYRPSMRKLFKNEKDDKEFTEEEEAEDEELCEADFEIGHFFKEFLVPKAVLYFTGELVDEASFDDDYDEEEDEEDDDDAAAGNGDDAQNDDQSEEDDEDEEELDDESVDNDSKNKKKSNSKSHKPKAK